MAALLGQHPTNEREQREAVDSKEQPRSHLYLLNIIIFKA